MINFIKKNYLVVILLAVAIFARFYRLADIYYFMMDEERDVFIASNILKGKFTLIGGSVPGGIFLGPLYFYLTAVLLFFSRLSPIGLAVFASAIGVLSAVLLYETVKLIIKDKTIAFFSALLYASSFLVVIYNRAYWPLTYAPMVSILTINFLYRILALRARRYIIPLALVQLIGVQTDPSNFSSFVTMLIFFVLYGIFRRYKKDVVISLVIILFAHLPLLLFDLRHNFFIANNVKNFFSMKQTKSIPLNKRLTNAATTFNLFFNTFSRVVYVRGNYDVIKQITISPTSLEERDRNVIFPLKALAIVLYGLFLLNSLKSRSVGMQQMFAVQSMVIISGILLYAFIFPGYMHEWFLNVFWPGFCVIFVWQMFSLMKNTYLKTGAAVFLALVCFLNLLNIAKSDNSLGYKYKQRVIDFVIGETKSRPFSLEGDLVWTGFEYLFRQRGVIPQKNTTDEAYNGWLYVKKNNQEFSDTLVLLFSPGEINEGRTEKVIHQYLKHEIKRKIFGGYFVMLVDNSTRWR